MGVFVKKRFKILYVSALLAVLFGVRLKAQENVGAWPSVETGPVISQSVPVNVKVKTPERMTAVPGKFAGPSRPVVSGFPIKQAGSPISRVGQSVDRTPPFPVLMPKAVVYPLKAIRRGWEGQTVVAAEVLPDGSVGRMALAKTSGHEVLDQAAQEAIKTWKFSSESGKIETAHYVDIPVNFKLEDRGEA
jgi:periplasmic protein TonB